MTTSHRPPARGGAHVRRRPFGTLADGSPVELYTLVGAGGVELEVLSLGGIIRALRAPDRGGALADVTLGYDAAADYERDPRYFGALVGRYANRIARGRFSLDGVEHALAANDPPNHLHGGTRGFNRVTWTAAPFERGDAAGLLLGYTSADGEEGYPGTLDVRVTYTLTAANALEIDYRAVTDAPTLVNLTQHAYWNLAGHDAGPITGHELTLAASRFTPVDGTLIPTGELRAVEGTPFDFTAPHAIGERIDAAGDAQLAYGQGYDHNWVLDGGEGGELSFAARLREPRSGRVLEVLTSEPGVQLYSGNVLPGGPAGKGGHAYGPREGVAIETQHFPDSPNQPHFPSTVLRPGEEYASRTVYRFSAG